MLVNVLLLGWCCGRLIGFCVVWFLGCVCVWLVSV